MKVTCIYWPEDRERMLFKRCVWATMNRVSEPKELPMPQLIRDLINARHSPIRVLNFAFLIEDIPSNIATHLTRHVHAVPFVSSLRNDRQNKIDGDNAPRNTPVNMVLFCNCEELLTIANKRLCSQASAKTRHVVKMMCDAATEKMPELEGYCVPMCEYMGGICREMNCCGRHPKR